MKRKIKKQAHLIQTHLLSDCIEEFLNDCKNNKNLAVKTLETYKTNLNHFYSCFDDIAIESLTNESLQKFNDYLVNRHTLSPNSINMIRRILNVFLKYCHQHYHIQLLKFDFMKVDKKQKVIFSDEEIKRISIKPNLNNCSYTDYKLWLMVQICLNTGARLSSIINLKKSDITKDSIIFHHTKSRKEQIFPLSRRLRNEINEYLSIVDLSTDYLFESSKNQKCTQNQITTAFIRYCKQRHCNCTSFHAIRHVYATKLYQKTHDIRLLQSILGHQDIQTTSRYLISLNLETYKDEVLKFNIFEELEE